MKATIEKFNRMVRAEAIDPEEFYCITLRGGEILLQGRFSSDAVKKYAKFNFKTTRHGYLMGHRYNIEITLT